MIQTLLPAARSRMERVTRRDFMVMAGSAVAMKAADVAFDRLVVDPAVEAAAPSDPLPHMRMDLGIREFDRLASTEQRAAWEGLKLNGSIPESAAGRCTKIAEIDGEIWRIKQGGEIAQILWGRQAPGRMADGPDRTFGLWRSECIRAARLKSEPTFELVRAVALGKPHRYTALIVPGADYVISAPETAIPAHTQQSTVPTTHPEIG